MDITASMMSLLGVATVWLSSIPVSLFPATQCSNIPESMSMVDIPKADLFPNILAATFQSLVVGFHSRMSSDS